ncbi:helix-turn-helix domain-containing protein [Flavobacterium covae]|uniref:helix-turn-helix domain-containing protein n=1 Tax=Flavobacterium covae TaxID=2906076 RepID=UPI0039A639AC
MKIGDKIKKAREAKGWSQKEVALKLNMDQSQYSKVENNKTDPLLSTIEKIIEALGITFEELISADKIFKDVDSFDKSLVEKIQLIEQLEENDKKSVFSIIDGLVAKQKLKGILANAMNI